MSLKQEHHQWECPNPHQFQTGFFKTITKFENVLSIKCVYKPIFKLLFCSLKTFMRVKKTFFRVSTVYSSRSETHVRVQITYKHQNMSDKVYQHKKSSTHPLTHKHILTHSLSIPLSFSLPMASLRKSFSAMDVKI